MSSKYFKSFSDFLMMYIWLTLDTAGPSRKPQAEQDRRESIHQSYIVKGKRSVKLTEKVKWVFLLYGHYLGIDTTVDMQTVTEVQEEVVGQTSFRDKCRSYNK